ncbi:MAG TPA: uroporphyrinogen-III synthase [Anaerolineales bacterium]|nr:uroporphyrinogen-III synthase [Anaerolineales bacterium]
MKVLITRPRAQADDFADKLRSAGFEPILFPVIEIRPVEDNTALVRAIEHLEKYAWVVFTSANAVEVVFSLTPTPLPMGDEQRVRVAAIGPKTAAALRQRGIDPDFVPEEYVAEAILPGLGDLQGKWVLLPRAEIARADLPEAIAKAGGIPHEIIVYRTLPASVDPDGLTALKHGVDVVTFTSASTVENFIALCKQHGLDPLNLPNRPLIACIGPITAQAAQEAGFEKIVVAKEYTTDGLLEAIARLEKL